MQAGTSSASSGQRQSITKLEVLSHRDRDDDPPCPWKRIHLTYRFIGQHIDEGHLRRAIALTEEECCSLFVTLRRAIATNSEYEILGEARR